MQAPRMNVINGLLAALLLGVCVSPAAAEQSPVDVWQAFLKPKYFADVDIVESEALFELKTPYRAEDAAFTPVSLHAKMPQTEERYIERYWLFVDDNPEPLVGVFRFTPHATRADLALRVRIDKYTHIRAIARLNTGEHYMVANFVKAQGGCSAPLGSDLKAAMERLGRMKFRVLGAPADDGAVLGQFIVSHPNITGLQMDQRTRLILPAHYVRKVRITYGGDLIMEAQTGISVSEDPSFRFFFKPRPGAVLKAEVEDSEGASFTEEFTVET